MKNIKSIPFVILSVGLCIFCFFFPTDVKLAVGEGINRCISVIIPSLYAMITASAILIKGGILSVIGRDIAPLTRRIFGMDGEEGSIFLFSLVSGYPVGAKMIYSMYTEGRLSKRNAELMAGLCFGSGTAFFFGCAASSAEIGKAILISNITAEILLAAVMSIYFRRSENLEKKSRKTGISADMLTECVCSSGKSLGEMCCCVVIFSVLAKILEKIGFFGYISANGGIIKAILDITAISEISVDVPTAAALISFGGLCVFFQISAIFRGKLSMLPFLMIRTAATFLSWGICRIYLKFFVSEKAAMVFAPVSRFHSESSPVPSVMLILMTGVVILETAKIHKIKPAE